MTPVRRVATLIARVQFSLERIDPMAKKQSDAVYRIIDVVGVSEKSWEDAGRIAVETAAGSLPASHFRSSTRLDPTFDLSLRGRFETGFQPCSSLSSALAP
jgi:dodecin